MKKLLFILFLLPLMLMAQTTYYVKPNGNDSNSGLDTTNAWGTANKAFATAVTAGDTVYFLGGVYNSKTRVLHNGDLGYGGDGTDGNPIVFSAYLPHLNSTTDTTWAIIDGTDTMTYWVGKYPVFDCTMHCDSMPVLDPYWSGYNQWLDSRGHQYIELRGLVIKNVFQCDTALSGAVSATRSSNWTYDRVHLYNIGQRGFWHSTGSWVDSTHCVDYSGGSPADCSPYFESPDTTRWLNCDVFNLCDTLATEPGNGADGWKAVSANFNYYYWEGCRAWNYSDDGVDPNHGKRVFKDFWVMSSNKYPYDGYFSLGNHNGLKATPLRLSHLDYYTQVQKDSLLNDSLVQYYNCLALFNPHIGFYILGYAPPIDTTIKVRSFNNTAYKNLINFTSVHLNLDTLGDAYYNNITYAPTATNAFGDPYECDILTNHKAVTSIWQPLLDDHPYWEYNTSYTITDADFQTVDSLELVALFTAGRQADGSLPVQRPLMLAASSDLIDGGTDIGLSYNGSAPDLGYSEYAVADTNITATFSANNVSIATGGSVNFTDNSSNSPDTWAWTLTGGTPPTSAVQNPTITYNTAGTYNVQLIASKNPTNADTLLRTSYITVTDVPVAQFSASATSVVAGAWVNFTDLSTNTPTSWSWVFQGGNPSTATTQNPSVLYSTAGTYNVTLTAGNAGGSDAEVKNGYITVSAASGGGYNVTISIY